MIHPVPFAPLTLQVERWVKATVFMSLSYHKLVLGPPEVPKALPAEPKGITDIEVILLVPPLCFGLCTEGTGAEVFDTGSTWILSIGFNALVVLTDRNW